MKSKYYLVIISKALRPMYKYRYYIVRESPYENVCMTDSIYEVKIWLDLNGLKFKRWYQNNYGHFHTGIEGVKYIISVEFCDKG